MTGTIRAVVPLGAGQVRGVVRAARIKLHDLHQRRAAAPDARFPLVCGNNFAGEAAEAGDSVDAPAPGDRVFGQCDASAHQLIESGAPGGKLVLRDGPVSFSPRASRTAGQAAAR